MRVIKFVYVIGIPLILLLLDYCLWKIKKFEVLTTDFTFYVIIIGLHFIGLFAVAIWLYAYKEIPLFKTKNQEDEKDYHTY